MKTLLIVIFIAFFGNILALNIRSHDRIAEAHQEGFFDDVSVLLSLL